MSWAWGACAGLQHSVQHGHDLDRGRPKAAAWLGSQLCICVGAARVYSSISSIQCLRFASVICTLICLDIVYHMNVHNLLGVGQAGQYCVGGE